jgi:hypothetical protein
MSTSRKKATPPGVAGNKSGEASDPADFADWCQMLGTITIGKVEFRIEMDELDLWMAAHPFEPATLQALRRKRAAVVQACLSNDPDAGLQAIEDLHQLVHLVRALPLAHEGAKARVRQGKRREGKGVNKDAVKRFHAGLGSDHDATSQTAAHFGLSTRRVREILAE